ncbi:MAG TPA: NUDIX hydrolase [Ktedonobacterales bacterium]|jgi:8-oxo-dGTP diphosphatase|nr:NUDIX hydrolase [Ktedonobacterales bacterium]
MINAPDTSSRQNTPPPPIIPIRARMRRMALGRLVGLWRVLPGRLKRLALRLRMSRVSVGVCALAQDEQGRLLVAHHTYRKYPWGLPGGLIGRGEHPEEALVRELREELGVEASVGSLIHAEAWPRGQHLTLYYTAILHGAPIVDGIEIDGFRYVTPDEARKLLGPAADRWLAALSARRAS